MNDPYNGNGRKSPEDDLGRSIEKEVKETIGTVAAALQDAAREVSTSLRDNESVQRTVKDLGAAARDGVQGIQSAIAQAQKNAEKEKRRRKRRDYAKKANGALSEAGGLMLPAGILAACAFSAFEPGDPAGALILGFISLWFFAGAFGAFLKSRTLRRIATYQSVLGERSYCTLQELSELTGKSQGAVRKDLFRLISSGKYEDVYLAPDGTRLFSGETAYRLYLAQRQAQQEAGARRQAQPARPEPAGVLAECRAFLSDLREQQRLISDAPVLEQVQRIESRQCRSSPGWKSTPAARARSAGLSATTCPPRSNCCALTTRWTRRPTAVLLPRKYRRISAVSCTPSTPRSRACRTTC